MSQQQFYVPGTITYNREDGTKNIFVCHEKLGHGGFAAVYRVTIQNTNKAYAIKVIPKERFESAKGKISIEKWKNEIKIQKNLFHQNVVKSKISFSDDFNYYIALEYCPGKSIREYLRNSENGRLSEPETRKILNDVIEGLIFLHNHQIIHHDLKLENFLIGADGKVKIADFGLATFYKEDEEKKYPICGTTNYLSPEIILKKSKAYSFEADVWAIGVAAFIMLTGKAPFDAGEKEKTYEKIKNCKYCFPSAIPISTEAKDFVKEILQIDPHKRPITADLLDHPFLTKLDKEQIQLYKPSQKVQQFNQTSQKVQIKSKFAVDQNNAYPQTKINQPQNNQKVQQLNQPIQKVQPLNQFNQKVQQSNQPNQKVQRPNQQQSNPRVQQSNQPTQKVQQSNQPNQKVQQANQPNQKTQRSSQQQQSIQIVQQPNQYIQKAQQPNQSIQKVHNRAVLAPVPFLSCIYSNGDRKKSVDPAIYTYKNTKKNDTIDPFRKSVLCDNEIDSQNLRTDSSSLKKSFIIPKHFITKCCFHDGDLGYLMGDGTVGVCFSDRSRIVMDPHEDFCQFYRYINSNGEVVDLEDYFQENGLNGYCIKSKHQDEINLVKKFAKAFKKYISLYEMPNDAYDPKIPLHNVKCYIKKQDTVLLKFNDNNVQVNFKDCRKLIIFWNNRKMCIFRNIKDKCDLFDMNQIEASDSNCEEHKKLKMAKDLMLVLAKRNVE